MSKSNHAPEDVIRVEERGFPIDELRAYAQRTLNRAVRGRVEIEFDTRRVVLDDVSGDDALRLHMLVKESNPGDPTANRWGDRTDPRVTDAALGLVCFRPSRVLSIRWFPERHVLEDDDHTALLDAAVRFLQGTDEADATEDESSPEESSDDSNAGDETESDDDDDDELAGQGGRGGTSAAPTEDSG